MPNGSPFSGLLGLLLAYAQAQRARMLAVQQRAFPSFGGQTQGLPITSGVMPSFPGRMVPFPTGRMMGMLPPAVERLSAGGMHMPGVPPAFVGQRLPPLPRFDLAKLQAIQEGATPQFSMDRFVPGARFAKLPEAMGLQGIPPALQPLLREEARQFEQGLLNAIVTESRDPRHLQNLLQALTRY